MDRASRLRRLADSYLDHTIIALRARDVGANFRDFLDPWWIYERGGEFVHERAGGGFSAHTFNNPCPWTHGRRLRQFDWCSQGADAILALGREAKIIDRKNHPVDRRLIVDHSVPFAVLKSELWRDPDAWTPASLRVFLSSNFKRAVLSSAENARLTHAKLGARMPPGWKLGDDPFARYRAVGIKSAVPHALTEVQEAT
jgi:hypothetical protein